MTITVDPKFPNSIFAAIIVDETNLPTYLPGRVIPMAFDRNGRVIISGTVSATLGTAVTLSDGITVATGSVLGALNYGWNGATWDRITSLADNADNVAAVTLGRLGTIARNTLFDGTNWDRASSLPDNAEAQAAGVVGLTGAIVRLQGWNGATFDRIRSLGDNADNIVSTTLGMLGTISRNTIFDGTFWDRARSLSDNVDGQASGTSGLTGVVTRGLLFNGTGWDRLRNNSVATLLPSAVRAATTSSTGQTNYNWRGAHVILSVTAVPGVDSITLSIEGNESATNTWYTLLTGVAVLTTGLFVYKIYPGITAVANGAVSDILPPLWRVTVTHSAATNFTYSVSSSLIL